MVLTTQEASYIIVLGIVISVVPISSTTMTNRLRTCYLSYHQWEYTQSSLEMIVDRSPLIQTMLKIVKIRRVRKPKLRQWSDFPVPPKYSISSREYGTLMRCGIHWQPACTLPYIIWADRISYISSMLADPRRTNHLQHTLPNIVTTAHNWLIQTMQSLIVISAPKYSHHCHYSM